MTVGRQKQIGLLLLGCMVLLVFWEVMAGRSARPWQPFQLTVADFDGFTPIFPGWVAGAAAVSSAPTEPNILAFKLMPGGPNGAAGEFAPLGKGAAIRGSLLIRLAHGYNMPECMKIKGYRVEAEVRSQRSEGRGQEGEDRGQVAEGGEQGTDERDKRAGCDGAAQSGDVMQRWRVTDSTGNGGTWITSVVRAEDFALLAMDLRTIAFPRVGIPDELGSEVRGVTWNSLRHPFQSLHAFFRAKWNGSRCDIATFLKLKQPAWASGEVLTVVTAELDAGTVDNEQGKMEQIALVHSSFCRQLQEWKAKRGGEEGGITRESRE